MYSIDNKMRTKKIASIKNAFKDLKKTFKSEENVAYFIGECENAPIQRIDTGSVALNAAIGGGLPMGRIVEMFGNESSGKSATSLKIIAKAQEANLICAYIDMEHTFDPIWSQKLGVNISDENLIISQPMHLQQAFYIIDALIDAGVDLIVVDSTAALTPKEELEGEPTKATVGLVARYMSQFLRRITPKLHKNNCSVIFLNQIRDNIGVMYGDPTNTPGGKALKFYSSLRIKLTKGTEGRLNKKVGGEDQQVGLHIKATAVKNKTATPYGRGEYKIYWDGRTVDDTDEIAEIALAKGIIPRYNAAGELKENGRNYKWETEPEFLAKSKAEVATQLKKFPKVKEEILQIINSGAFDAVNYNSDSTEDELDEGFDEEFTEEDSFDQFSEAEEIETEF